MNTHDFEDAVRQLKPFLSQYLEEQGIDTTKKFRCLHPEHNDGIASANIVGQDTDTPRVYCHGCSRTLDIFDVVVLLEDKPKTGLAWVNDTLKYLATKYNVSVSIRDLTDDEVYQLDIYRAYKVAAKLIQPLRSNNIFMKELSRRGWTPETLSLYSIGTVSCFSDFFNALKEYGFFESFLTEIELGRQDIFDPRNIIFTWKDEQGKVIGFTSRYIPFEEERAIALKSEQHYKTPKYNNTRTSGLKLNIFQKGKRFYGIDTVLKLNGPLYIFEGQADVTTARHAGLFRCVAIAGSTMSQEQIHLLKELGIYDIVLCLDGDEVGRQKTKEILETRLAGNRDLRVRIIELPDNEDPDSFIRNHGLESFKELACWSAFEWRLNQYPEDANQEDLCRQMIPFIVNEPSAITREQQCKALSRRTGISLSAINEELHILLDEKAHVRSRERQNILDQLNYSLRNNPTNAELILQEAQVKLYEATRKYDKDILSPEDFLTFLQEQQMQEQQAAISVSGFKLGADLRELEDVLRGEWSKSVFMCFGGKPNAGKSALLSKIAYEIATNNEDVCVIYHTIDDSAGQLAPRFVAIAEGSCRLTINMVRQPVYWTQNAGEWILDKRTTGYDKIKTLAKQARLVIKDITHGSGLAFAESLIAYYQDKYPDRRVVYILDNFHKLNDFNGEKDERVRFKKLSEYTKMIALRRKCCIMSSVEYTKMPAGVKPTDNNIGESVQIRYDANFIAHVYSEVSDIPDTCSVFHMGTDWKGGSVMLPRVELIIGKNKITDLKTSLFFDFYPASSDYRYVSQETVVSESRQAKDRQAASYEQKRYSNRAEAIDAI